MITVRFFGAPHGAHEGPPGGERLGAASGVTFHYFNAYARCSRVFLFADAERLPEGPTAFVDEDPPPESEEL